MPEGTELVSAQEGSSQSLLARGQVHTHPLFWILPGTAACIPPVFAVCLLDGGCGKEEVDSTLRFVQDLPLNFPSPPNPRVTGRIFSFLEPPMRGLAMALLQRAREATWSAGAKVRGRNGLCSLWKRQARLARSLRALQPVTPAARTPFACGMQTCVKVNANQLCRAGFLQKEGFQYARLLSSAQARMLILFLHFMSLREGIHFLGYNMALWRKSCPNAFCSQMLS